MNTIEEWRAIDGRPYDVSSLGNVRSLRSGKNLKPRRHTNGYLRVSLGAGAEAYIHRLVAVAFLGSAPPDQNYVDHVNYSRADNRLENLRWISLSDNLSHRRFARGEASGMAKLKSADIENIRGMKAVSTSALAARRYGVAPRTIRDVWNNVTWKRQNG